MLSWVVEHPESICFFAVALVCLLQSFLLKRDFFSPACVYCFSQSITIGIAYLKLDSAMTDFKPTTWMIWIGGCTAFMVGCYLTRLAGKTKNVNVNYYGPKEPRNYDWKLHVALSFIPFALFLIGVYGLISVAGNLLVFTDNPAKWMDKDINYGYYSLLFSSGPLSVLLFGVASFKKFNTNVAARRIALAMVFVTIVLNVMAYPNRTSLFLNIGLMLIMFNYLSKRISAVVIMSVLVFAMSAFVAISSIRDQYGGGSVEGKAMDAVMSLPYKYIANNYWNLDYAVSPPNHREIHPHTYGIDFFSGIFEYARLPGSFKTALHWDTAFNDRVQKVFGFNTVNYLWDVYKDLYLPGVFLFPFFCGMLLTVLHVKLCNQCTPKQVAFYAFFIYFVGWWFFTSGYKQGIYCMWAMIAYVVMTCCEKRLPADATATGKVECQLETEKQISSEG